jgi:UDP-2,3-diacylglucosamine hydrolase
LQQTHALALRNKTYFASDLHLGAPDHTTSLAREKHFVQWLNLIAPDAKELYLLGDVFDFWFEYRRAVPKGYVRILGKLAELHDQGVVIHYFAGNHDMWLGNYFTEQFGAEIVHAPVLRVIHGRTCYLHHGDGLGPGDRGYKFIKSIFRNRLCQWAFHRLHPNFGIGLADFLSKRSRRKTGHLDAIDHGEKEFLLQHARNILKEKPEIDYFVFGHRHFPKYIALDARAHYINLGDWIRYHTYLEADDAGFRIMQYPVGGVPQPYPAAVTAHG